MKTAFMILFRFADGYWHNLCKNEPPDNLVAWITDALKIGMAIAYGWLEQDDTWVRITSDGKIQLNEMARLDDRKVWP